MQVSNFSDLFKSNSDLLSKDFPLTNKLEVNTNTENGIKLTSILNRDSKTSSAELKAKYSCKSFAVTETWNTANVLGLVAESTVNGVKLEANSTLNANNGKTASKFSAEFKQKNLFSRAFVDVFKGPTIGGDVVVGNDLLIVGGDVAYDVAEARVERFNAALAHVGNGYNLGLQAYMLLT